MKSKGAPNRVPFWSWHLNYAARRGLIQWAIDENRQTKWMAKALSSMVTSQILGDGENDQNGCNAPAGPLEFRQSQTYL